MATLSVQMVAPKSARQRICISAEMAAVAHCVRRSSIVLLCCLVLTRRYSALE